MARLLGNPDRELNPGSRSDEMSEAIDRRRFPKKELPCRATIYRELLGKEPLVKFERVQTVRLPPAH